MIELRCRVTGGPMTREQVPIDGLISRPDWAITDETYQAFAYREWVSWHTQCPLWVLSYDNPRLRKPGDEMSLLYNREDCMRLHMGRLEAAGTPYRVQSIRHPAHTYQDMMDDLKNSAPSDPAPTTPDPLAPRKPFGLGAALREALKDPVVAQQFADVGNGLAAGLRATAAAEAEAAAPAVVPEPTVMDCLQRVELRVGTVIEADRVPKSNKLLRLMIDLGEPAPRQILAGLGKCFAPEEMVGRRLVVVANLPPIKMMGLESCGMILAAGEADMLSVFQPTGMPANGARLK